MSRTLDTLSPREVLALAIHVEQSNSRRFRAFAEVFQGYDPDVAKRFEELAAEEDHHEQLLDAQFRKKFGGTLPPLDQVDVSDVVEAVDLDDGEHLIFDTLKPRRVYELALKAERGAQEFYRKALAQAGDPTLAALYRELAEMETGHASFLEEKLRTS
ncbi:MAG TPA: ferritin family protein [Planctomycetota bacterium]|nr:ferritin family protein [Planctomycetota bacterium]